MTMVQGTFRPQELHTRFLYPFFFERGKANQAYEDLSQASITAHDSQHMNIWECAPPPALYTEELLDHVDRFLFKDAERGCRYLRTTAAVNSRWFNKAQVVISEPKEQKEATIKAAVETFEKPKKISWPVSLAHSGIEVFLTNYGVGVLSISLAPKLAELDFENVTLFNYKLSQLRPQVSAQLHIPHPSENKEKWADIPVQQKQRIPAAPNADAPLSERLGFGGGSFLLGELISQVLLSPLRDLDLRPAQNQLSVYTVVRFGDEVDFEESDVVKALAAFLSGISQVEEPTHAGAPTGVLGITNAILNRRHSAAVGLLGMAHIVSDQPIRELSFNKQRVPRVLLKYFAPYLVALLQRISLHRTISEASNLVLSHDQNRVAGLAILRRHMLEFAVEGYFPEISSREVIDRYYRLVQDGLGVRRAFEDARRAVAEIDAQHTSERHERLSMIMAENLSATKSLQEQMTEHLQVVAKVQSTVEWIEIFLVSVYLAHLWDMFSAHVESLHPWVPLGVIAAAIIGALGASAILKPWRHRKHNKRQQRA
jgi:hypothetical protein